MKQLGFFISISILFHFLVSTSTLYFAEKAALQKMNDTPTEIEFIDKNKQPDINKFEQTRQLIKQLKSKVEQLKEKTAARFESEQTQRVLKETKATKFGLTENSTAQIAAPKLFKTKPDLNKTTPEKAPEIKTPKTDGELPEFARQKHSTAQIPISRESSISTSLPNDIQQSNATNLNTDANTYYSFYSRVEELFYVRWVERNNYHWSRISFDYKKNVLSGKIWSTNVEIWLAANGEFHSAYIKQPSGYQLFDEAAVFAFKDTKLFPNPPKAKVEADGFVRLRYRFNVHVAAY